MFHTKNNIRYVAIDFETTGLDLIKDEPIQIGIVVSNERFEIIESFQSLIKPKKKIKELKSVVSHITWLQLADLQESPSIEDLLPIIQKLIGPESVLIGHNIWFDLWFLKKYWPEVEVLWTIDTYVRGSMLLHYQSSYSLEVLWESVSQEYGASLVFVDEKWEAVDNWNSTYHDALYDSFVSLWLFRFLYEKIQGLCVEYPGLETVLSRAEDLDPFFETDPRVLRVEMPQFGKPVSLSKKLDSNYDPLTLSWLKTTSTRYMWNIPLREFLERTCQDQPIIYAVHTRQKLDIIKHHLHDLWQYSLWFAKGEQIWDHWILTQIANQERLASFEWQFIVKYLSHDKQWLRIIDLRNDDYKLYQLCKVSSKSEQQPIMLMTHGWLYHLLDNPDYDEYTICFLDADWRHYTYNKYSSQRVDLNYFSLLLDQWYYVFRRRSMLEGFDVQENKKIAALLYSFKQSFTVFLGTLGIEVTKKFTGVDARYLELDPIIWNDDYFNTNKLRGKILSLSDSCRSSWGEESWGIQTQRENIVKTLNSVMRVDKKMQDNKYLHYTFSQAHSYTEFSEFLEVLSGHQVLFCSNHKSNNTRLAQGNTTTKSFTHCRDQNQLVNLLKEQPHKRIFILSSAKHISQSLFDKLTQLDSFSSFTILAENISWWTGKNIYRLKDSAESIVIWWYYFLLAIFAKKEPLDIIIVHHAAGPLKDLILSDCLYYMPSDWWNWVKNSEQ